jgi:hypothetical protein
MAGSRSHDHHPAATGHARRHAYPRAPRAGRAAITKDLADRIAVMYRGRIVGIVDATTSRETLGRMMAGATV